MIVKLIYHPPGHLPVVMLYEVPVEVLLDITFQLAEYEKAGGETNEVRVTPG